MQQEIIEFINRRFSKDCNWINGNCYWFAKILCTRFQNLQLYYLPIVGHFIAGTNEQYYDWTGLIKPTEKPLLFSEIIKEDPLWASHILRDCRD